MLAAIVAVFQLSRQTETDLTKKISRNNSSAPKETSGPKPPSQPLPKDLDISKPKPVATATPSLETTSNPNRGRSNIKPSPDAAKTPTPRPALPQTPAPTVKEAREPALSDQEIYSRFSKAVIQIYCSTPQELFAASGVVVNERGLVLTNAHVAEIVKKAGESNCQARHGNPAASFAKLKLIFEAGVALKIADTQVPQRDIAFLQLFDSKDSFGVAEINTADAAEDETVLTLGYPSEFLQGINTESNSNLVFSTLKVDGFVDIDGDKTTAEGYIFRGGLALQQGSSGTALINRSGKIVGIIFATTKAETTQDREGVGLTVSYIDKIMRLETGLGLSQFISSH